LQPANGLVLNRDQFETDSFGCRLG
jgi:hypothetical protein